MDIDVYERSFKDVLVGGVAMMFFRVEEIDMAAHTATLSLISSDQQTVTGTVVAHFDTSTATVDFVNLQATVVRVVMQQFAVGDIIWSPETGECFIAFGMVDSGTQVMVDPDFHHGRPPAQFIKVGHIDVETLTYTREQMQALMASVAETTAALTAAKADVPVSEVSVPAAGTEVLAFQPAPGHGQK